MKMTAPIPGMSLTREPGNAPYEQPPLYNTAEEALAFYMEMLNDEDKVDDVLFTLENGYPVEALVDAMTSVGVMEGYHTVDVKILVAPVLHEWFVNLATASGISFKETVGPSREERLKERDKKRTKLLLQKMMEDPETPSTESQQEASQLMAQTPSPEEPLVKRRM